MEHLVGLRRAGTIVAINKSPKAPILKAADLGIVADYTTCCRTSRRRCARDAAGRPRRAGDRRGGDRLRHRACSGAAGTRRRARGPRRARWRVVVRRGGRAVGRQRSGRGRAPRASPGQPRPLSVAGGCAPRRDRRGHRARPRRRAGPVPRRGGRGGAARADRAPPRRRVACRVAGLARAARRRAGGQSPDPRRRTLRGRRARDV